MMKIAAFALLLAVALAPTAHADRLLTAACGKGQSKCGAKCVDLFTDAANCGKCGLKCGRSYVCAQGGCVCPRWRPSICTDTCVNTMKDPMNCGFCSNVCPSGACANGACTGTGPNSCGSEQKWCKGKCLNTQTDNKNCGKCGHACTAGTICVDGGCSCPKIRPDLCGTPAVCTNKLIDRNNCGWCGNKCKTGTKCSMGQCVKA